MENRQLVKWEDYPFVVYLNDDGAPFTGTLLSPYYVLTAAHCIFDHKRTQTTDVSKLRILFHNGEERSGLKDVYLPIRCHDNYGANSHNNPRFNDAAIIKLCRPIESVTSVRLVDSSDQQQYVTDDSPCQDAEIIGWDGSGPDRLWCCPTKARIDDFKVDDSYPRFLHTTRATKPGDSGGPLLVKSKTDSSLWLQIGIHSASDEFISRSERLPNTTTLPWIRKVIRPCNRRS